MQREKFKEKKRNLSKFVDQGHAHIRCCKKRQLESQTTVEQEK